MPNFKLIGAGLGFLVCCLIFPPTLALIPIAVVLYYRHRVRAAVDVHRFDRRTRKHKQLTR